MKRRIVKPLHLPSDDSVLDVNLPGATARAIDAVRAADDLVVLPAIAVELFPPAELWCMFVFDPAVAAVFAH